MKNRRNNLFYTISILIAVAASWYLCFTCLAADEVGKTVKYRYSADKTDFGKKSGITILKGNAKFLRNDGDYLYADQITMYRDSETNELIKIESVGNVDMKEKDMVAKCERSIFYEKEEFIEFRGSADKPAIVDDGKNMMEAPFITYDRVEERISASGLLFETDLEPQSELNSGTLSAGLKQEFQNNRISLSENITVSTDEMDVKWSVADGEKTYTIKNEEGKIKVYADGSVSGHVTVEVKENESGTQVEKVEKESQ